MNKLMLFLLILGGINMGSVGLFEFDIIAWAFDGVDSLGARIVYSTFSACAIWCISLLFSDENRKPLKVQRKKW
ncbi:MAG: DUF378 domain-containing protein [Oscillospiraceae bacterium]|jgi:uncharacterized membrane protein YuzA (DUF378 family)|nr:DUF378 domain-containing protein [Oscillospiraceae bacterium]